MGQTSGEGEESGPGAAQKINQSGWPGARPGECGDEISSGKMKLRFENITEVEILQSRFMNM